MRCHPFDAVGACWASSVFFLAVGSVGRARSLVRFADRWSSRTATRRAFDSYKYDAPLCVLSGVAQHLRSNDGAIQHGGDEREGDEKGDDEKIHLNLAMARGDSRARATHWGCVWRILEGR